MNSDSLQNEVQNGSQVNVNQTQESKEIVLGKEDEKKIKLKSSDGVTFIVPAVWITEMSGLIKDMTEDNEDTDEIIPLPNIKNSEILKKIIDYCEYHHNNKAPEIEKPLQGKIEDVISEWDKNYIQMSKEMLIDLTLAANYIYCKDLLDLCCATIASLVKGKSVEEMREFFGVENDFTPEEEEKIREENKWIEDDN